MKLKIPIICFKKDNFRIYQRLFAAAIEKRNCLIFQLYAICMKFSDLPELYSIHMSYQKIRRNIYEYFS